jgi:hypothetical protein
MALGDFMKQYDLDIGSAPLHAQGRSSSMGAAAAAEEALISPGVARLQQRSLVSPGVRRRRQQHGSQGSSSQEQDWDADEAGSEDQPQAHVKRSKGSKAHQQEQQQQQQHYWQDPNDPAYQAAMLAQLPTHQHARQSLQERQLPAMQRAFSADQALGSQPELQALVAGVPAAAAASSLLSGGRLELQGSQQQQAMYPSGGTSLLPPPSLRWRTEVPQLGDSAGAGRVEQAAMAHSAEGAAVGPELQQPAVLRSVLETQQDLPAHADQQQQDASRQTQQELKPAAATAAAAADAPSKPLLSPAGRPIRQLALRERQRAAAAATAARYERGSQTAGYLGGIRHLQVWCDQLPGMLDLQRMQVVPQQGEVSAQL